MEACSSRELVCLHLDGYPRPDGDSPAPLALTAAGIGDALEFGSTAAARIRLLGVLEDLHGDGLVEAVEHPVDDRGGPRTVYYLTDDGRETAAEVRERLADVTVEVTNGSTEEVTLAEIDRVIDESPDPLVTALARLTDDGQVPLDRYVGERFVDRQEELASVRSAIVSIANRGSRTVVVGGDGGMGKTALVREAIDAATEDVQDLLAIRGTCPAGPTDPYAPLRQAFDGLPNGDELNDLLAERREAVTPDDPAKVDAQRTALYNDVADAVRAASTDRPLVVFLDNLQWADEATLALFTHLATSITEWVYPVAFVGAYREPTVAAASDHPLEGALDRMAAAADYTHLTLGPLARGDTRALLATVVERQQLPEAFVDLVHEQTGGVPLFVTETATHLLERGAVDPDVDAFPTTAEEIQLPGAVIDQIDRRLRHLDDASRELVRLGAVIGEHVPIEVLDGASDLAPARRREYVDLLVASRIWERASTDGGPAPGVAAGDHDLRFVSGGVREAVVAGLPDDLAREYHGRVASVLDSMGTDDVDVQTTRIAHHYAEAGEYVAAVDGYRRAGDEAKDSYANEDAIENYRQALELAAEHGVLDGDGQAAIVEDIAAVHDTVGEFDAALETIERGLSLASQRSRERCELLGLQATVEGKQGAHESAMGTAKRGRELASSIGETDLEAEAIRRLGFFNRKLGDMQAARHFHERSLELAREADDRGCEARTLRNLGVLEQQTGDLAAARERYEAGLEIYRETDDRYGQARTLNNLGVVADSRGQYDDAREYYQSALEILREIGDPHGAGLTLTNLGVVARKQGAFDAAREYYEESLEIARSIGDREGQATILGNLGVVADSEGDVEAAREFHEESLELAREVGDRSQQARTLTNLGMVEQSQARLDRARRYHRDSLDIREAIDDEHGVAISLANLGLVAAAERDFESAESYHERSLSILESVGDRRVEAIVLGYLGTVQLERGELEAAHDSLAESREIVQELDDPHQTAISEGLLGAVELRQGDVEAGRERLDEALSALEAVGGVADQLRVLRYHVAAEADAGSTERARTLCADARERIDAAGSPLIYERERIESRCSRIPDPD